MKKLVLLILSIATLAAGANPTAGQFLFQMKPASGSFIPYGVTPVSGQAFGWDGTNVVMIPVGSGGMESFSLAGSTGTPQTITDGNTLSILAAAGLTSVASNTDTVTIGLSAGTVTSLGLANTSTQPGDNVSTLNNDAGYLSAVSWGIITGKPTTLSGYGITDAQPTINLAANQFYARASAGVAEGKSILDWGVAFLGDSSVSYDPVNNNMIFDAAGGNASISAINSTNSSGVTINGSGAINIRNSTGAYGVIDPSSLTGTDLLWQMPDLSGRLAVVSQLPPALSTNQHWARGSAGSSVSAQSITDAWISALGVPDVSLTQVSTARRLQLGGTSPNTLVGQLLLARSGFLATYTPAVLTGSRTYTFPDVTGTVALTSQTVLNTGAQTMQGPLTITGEVKAIRVYYDAGPGDFAGNGTPEGNLPAPVGSTYRRSDGGSGTSFYIKESGAGDTGWIAK